MRGRKGGEVTRATWGRPIQPWDTLQTTPERMARNLQDAAAEIQSGEARSGKSASTSQDLQEKPRVARSEKQTIQENKEKQTTRKQENQRGHRKGTQKPTDPEGSSEETE
ncbi:hypothetical protein SLE2022_016540 [Rubroshorea leprosula]